MQNTKHNIVWGDWLTELRESQDWVQASKHASKKA